MSRMTIGCCRSPVQSVSARRKCSNNAQRNLEWVAQLVRCWLECEPLSGGVGKRDHRHRELRPLRKPESDHSRRSADTRSRRRFTAFQMRVCPSAARPQDQGDSEPKSQLSIHGCRVTRNLWNISWTNACDSTERCNERNLGFRNPFVHPPNCPLEPVAIDSAAFD